MILGMLFGFHLHNSAVLLLLGPRLDMIGYCHLQCVRIIVGCPSPITCEPYFQIWVLVDNVGPQEFVQNLSYV